MGKGTERMGTEPILPSRSRNGTGREREIDFSKGTERDGNPFQRNAGTLAFPRSFYSFNILNFQKNFFHYFLPSTRHNALFSLLILFIYNSQIFSILQKWQSVISHPPWEHAGSITRDRFDRLSWNFGSRWEINYLTNCMKMFLQFVTWWR